MGGSRRQPLFVAPPIHSADGIPRISRVLIANRGEIACRIIRTCNELGITSIAVYTDEDKTSLHVQRASEAYHLGSADQQPYLNIELLVDIAKRSEADAIHPGYGYLSENARFAEAVSAAGMVFIGPTPETIAALGDKSEAKTYLKEKSNVPLIPGYSGPEQDPVALMARADEIGYPVMIKASAGGGGKGMRIVYEKSDFQENFTRCVSEAQRAFGSGHCLVEKYIEAGKHVEIQIFGDGETSISLLDRECSVQRRHQKVVEESPCPWMGAKMRQRMSAAALEISQLLQYRSAGTVEFIVDILTESFYFLEVNTRIQVEHPITEEVTGIDIVALQIYVAGGGKLTDLPQLQNIKQQGHAIEVRLCAEDPFNGFLPCNGTLRLFKPCDQILGAAVPDVRYESGVGSGSEISTFFDSMISKIVVWSPDRSAAIRKMIQVLKNTICLGVTTNHIFLQRILSHPAFQMPDYTTAFIDKNKDALLKPLDSRPILGAAAVVATLFHRATSAKPSAFGSIPSSFRNQRRDKTAHPVTYLSCDLKVLGYPEAATVAVVSSGPGRYEISRIEAERAPTNAEKKAYFNKISGSLVTRYYSALKSDDVQAVENVQVLKSRTNNHRNSPSGMYRVSIDGKALTYHLARGPSDELRTTIFVQCPGADILASYVLMNKLTWAGKLTERASGALEGGSGKKYISPMPGKVLQVLAKDGSEVKVGDGLLVMESMKTEVRTTAASSGIVRMFVAEGDSTTDGTVLCEIESPEELEGEEGGQ